MPSQGGCSDQWECEAHELDRFQVSWDVGNHGNIYHEMSRIADHHHGILWNHGWPVREGKVKLMENWKSKCLDSDHSFFGQVAWLQWKISWKLCWSPKIYNVPLYFWGLLFWLIFLHNSDPSWQNRILKTGRWVNAIVRIIISLCAKRAFLGKRSRIGGWIHTIPPWFLIQHPAQELGPFASGSTPPVVPRNWDGNQSNAICEAQIGFEIGVLTYSRLLQQTFLHMAMAVVPLESQLYFGQFRAKSSNKSIQEFEFHHLFHFLGLCWVLPKMERKSLEWNWLSPNPRAGQNSWPMPCDQLGSLENLETSMMRYISQMHLYQTWEVDV